MNKKSLVTVIIIIVVVGIILTVRSQKATTISTNTPSNEQVSTPGFYSSPVYNISFSYPTKYILDEKQSTTGKEKRTTISLITESDRQLMSLADGNNSIPSDVAPASITVDVFPGAAISQTADEWVRKNNNSNFKLSPNHQLASTTIAGIPAVTYTWSGLLSANSIVFAYKGNIYMMSMNYITPQDVIWKDFPVVIQSLKLK